MRLLIIEDEPKTANYLKKGLNEHGFIADIGTNGEDGIHFAMHQKYDLIILDVMLPKKNGWKVLIELRGAGCQTPILLLTAQDSVLDKVKGLELGADDYLVKPFAFSELLARIRTVLRRGQISTPDVASLADLEIDFLKRKAKRADIRLELTPKEFALLSLFMRRMGEVISRTIIAEQIWDMNFDSDTNVVDVAIKRLRRKIDDPFDVKLIHTIRGVGYVLELREE